MAIGKLREVSITNATEPVTLAEAKNYLRVDNSVDDTKITSMISAARAIAEAYINRDILPRQREQYILRDTSSDGVIELYNTPINSSVAVTVSLEGVATTNFELLGPSDNPYISLDLTGANEVNITYTTLGLTSSETVRQGILAILSELYEFGEVKNKWIWTILNPIRRRTI